MVGSVRAILMYFTRVTSVAQKLQDQVLQGCAIKSCQGLELVPAPTKNRRVCVHVARCGLKRNFQPRHANDVKDQKDKPEPSRSWDSII